MVATSEHAHKNDNVIVCTHSSILPCIIAILPEYSGWREDYCTVYYTESEREANLTATRALELALLYNFVTELTSLIVVADDNFTLGDGPNGNGGLEESLGFLGGPLSGGVPVPQSVDLAVRT